MGEPGVGGQGTSAIEAHIGTWLEEVARIVSGGIKPGNGVDLQLQAPDGTVQLYAIQAAPNTKNAGGRRSDIEALRRGARPLRAHKQRVELYVAVLSGRATSAVARTQSDVTVLGSDEFWERVSGIADFRARLVRASTILSWLVRRRSEDEVARIKAEAIACSRTLTAGSIWKRSRTLRALSGKSARCCFVGPCETPSCTNSSAAEECLPTSVGASRCLWPREETAVTGPTFVGE